MLLGCCHCGQPAASSLSTPPSSSSSSGAETITGTCSGITKCLNNIAPARYILNVTDPSSGSGVCKSHYYGSFMLYFRTNSCFIYDSAERPKVDSSGCANHTVDWRWTLQIAAFVSNNTSMAVQGKLYTGGFLQAIVTFRYPTTGNVNPAPDCVQEFTLTKTSTDSLGYNFPTTATITPS